MHSEELRDELNQLYAKLDIMAHQVEAVYTRIYRLEESINALCNVVPQSPAKTET